MTTAQRILDKEGMRTPWGKADQVYDRGEGIISVSTPGHGGLKLDRKRNAMVHPAWRCAGGWYEEDLDWAIVALTFKGVAGFDEDDIKQAHQTLRDYYPDEYQTATGEVLTSATSRELAEREEKEAARGKLQITGAWGNWATNVLPGQIGVSARVDGDRLNPERYFVMAAEEYNAIPGRMTRVLPENVTPIEVFEGECPFRSRTG
jgi:hypothetical protein